MACTLSPSPISARLRREGQFKVNLPIRQAQVIGATLLRIRLPQPCRILSCCYEVADLSNSQNIRGDKIFNCSILPTLRSIASPVTNTSARPFKASPKTIASSISTGADTGRCDSTICVASPDTNPTIRSASCAGSFTFFCNAFVSSSRTFRPRISSCSSSTRSKRSAQRPRAAKALTRTLVSRNTLKRQPETRPHR